MKNRKSISQAIIIQCCYKRYTAGSYAAENKSNVKMLQDKNKYDEASQTMSGLIDNFEAQYLKHVLVNSLDDRFLGVAEMNKF